MGFLRTHFHAAVLPVGLLLTLSILVPPAASAQAGERIWGRVRTVSGRTLEGFIRWDRNEAVWADLLDGYKDTTPFQFQDWWRLAHPGSHRRDRVVELAGYRITWDDDEPTFPESVESGIRMGHIRTLAVTGDDSALLTLRSGREVELSGGATDLGSDLREILVEDQAGRITELKWDDLDSVEFFQAPAGARTGDRRLYGTVYLEDDSHFTGYLAWDVIKVLTSEDLEGKDAGGRSRSVGFGRIESVRPTDHGAVVTLVEGGEMELFGTDDVDSGNDGVSVSDPWLGQVAVDWGDIGRVDFHPPDPAATDGTFDGGLRLTGTVTTIDSTELHGWIRWDGDEEFTWEMLDGRMEGTSFDVEFGLIASIEKHFSESTVVNLGPRGVRVSHPLEDGSRVVLKDGRELILDGSNDVSEENHGIFILPDTATLSPEDEEAEWIMVRWEDFQSVRFDEGGSEGEGGRE